MIISYLRIYRRRPISLGGRIVALDAVELNLVGRKAMDRAHRLSKDVESFKRKYPNYEFARQTYILQRLQKSKSVLDVGVGRGYFANMLQWSKKFDRVCGIDIVDRPASRFVKGVDFKQMSVTDIKYKTNEFETVTCMEVLEHLEPEDLDVALKELRRVCKGQLIVSVPYHEPLPLPSYHKQQFTEKTVLKKFPGARYSLMLKKPVNRVPWLLIDENQ